MFTHLIESSSHKKEFERRGTFFLGTLAAYALLLAGAGVASIYAYDAQLGEQNLDTATLVMSTPVEMIPRTAVAAVPSNAPRRSNTTQTMTDTNAMSAVPVRQHMIEDIRSSTKAPETIGTVGSKELPALPNAKISAIHSDPIGSEGVPSFIGNAGKGNGNNTRAALDVVEHEMPPAALPRATTPVRKAPPVTVSLGVINGRALRNPVPVYPPIAKATKTAGTVNVQVLLNEEGRIISAQALSGPMLLRDAAVKAAYQAIFSPTLLSHQTVKASGIITYNFKLE